MIASETRSTVRYRFAKNRFGKVVDIRDLDSGLVASSGPFACSGCGQRLAAKIRGERREPHFAHYRTVCACESYLHRTAKDLFKQVFEAAVADGRPFLVEFDVEHTCPEDHRFAGPRTFLDITKRLSNVSLEKTHGDYRFDIFLEGGSSVLAVEIDCSNPVDADKSAAGIPIVELRIRNERDLASIISARLPRRQVTLYGIRPVARSSARADCPRCRARATTAEARDSRVLIHVVERNGKSWIASRHPVSARRRLAAASRSGAWVAEAIPAPKDRWREWKKAVRRARMRGMPVISCLACRHGDIATHAQEKAPFWCYLKEQHCATEEALTCQDFSKEGASMSRT